MSISSAEKLLEEYKKVVDVSSIVSMTNPKGYITYANDAFCEISGFKREELIGSNHNLVRHPDMPSSAFKEMWETIQSKNVWKGIVKNKKKDGSYYYVSATVVPIINKQEQVEQYIALRQDVTELMELTNKLEERVTEEVEKNREKDARSLETFRNFLNSSPNPIIVYDKEKVEFVNDNFLDKLTLSREDVCGKFYNLESILEERDGFLSSLNKISKNYRENKISIKSSKGRRIYYLIENEIQSTTGSLLRMFTFNDITLNEYQKLKIKNYSNRLEDFISRRAKKDSLVEEKSKTIKEETTPEQPKEKRDLTKEEMDVLKASRSGKAFSAVEYSAEVDEYVKEELQELQEIENEVEEIITEYEEDNHISHIHSISNRYSKYASIINGLFEFRDLAFAINSLANLLSELDDTMLDPSQQKKLGIFIGSLIQDLANWRRSIFVEQSALDIHYLDSSLFSTILQLEGAINVQEEIDEEDELELF
ncbi:MAG: PAS domain S-box protein [Campylobacterales bacterium]|nr:PAS domain S-box protein [Campylobacterales bacterium]